MRPSWCTPSTKEVKEDLRRKSIWDTEPEGTAEPCDILPLVQLGEGHKEHKEESDLTVFPLRSIATLLSTIRDKDLPCAEYSYYCDRLCRVIAEETLGCLSTPKTITTPCGSHHGSVHRPSEAMAVVSVVRSGDILMEAFRALSPGIGCAKILIQRDENDPEKRAKLFYSKLPPHIASCELVLLTDPMLATGGSALKAIEVLLAAGVTEERIVSVFVIAAPEGVARLRQAHPKMRVFLGAMDSHLNEDKYIVPGLGDFGDRYFNT